jgi:hypothetical protein
MLRRFAISIHVQSRLREAEDLLSIEQLLFSRVVELGLRSALRLLLRGRWDAGEGHREERASYALAD